MKTGVPVKLLLSICSILGYCAGTMAQRQQFVRVNYSVSVKDTAAHLIHVECDYDAPPVDTVVFSMPVWMPGYYQIMDYSQWVENFTVATAAGKSLAWQKIAANHWQVVNGKNLRIKFSYDVKAEKKFVANSYVDGERAYLSPAGIFMHPAGQLRQPVNVALRLPEYWGRVATGLDSLGGKNPYTYRAADFDLLYDCPILMGHLEELPAFAINGIPHRFIAFKPGNFNRAAFMNDLKKLVQAGIDIIGDIPYKQYTFIGIGPGRGGIEHLNNTTISFKGEDLNTANGRERMLSFIAHEYFHHYNVKRIRPVELGPFDYDRANRSNQLWISEGLTVYYEYLMLRRAELTNNNGILKQLSAHLNAYEGNTGKLYQSLQQAGYATWSDGPFGRTGDSIVKTISYYDKGPVIGMLLDFAIRHASNNRQSLDDVMRLLYNHFYRQLQRGFTEAEFQQACETAAGKPLTELFEYVYTVKPVDYNKYLAYAGLQVSSTARPDGKPAFEIRPLENADALQRQVLKAWMGE